MNDISYFPQARLGKKTYLFTIKSVTEGHEITIGSVAVNTQSGITKTITNKHIRPYALSEEILLQISDECLETARMLEDEVIF